MRSWLLASGDFVPVGGMDTANHALASYLARQDDVDVHLVAHRVSADLCAHASVRVHHVPRPFGLNTLGEPLLASVAGRRARRIRRQGGLVIANGGNVDAGDVSWVHYVHAAYEPSARGTLYAAVVAARHRRYVAAERRVLNRARLIICNSTRTMSDVVHGAGVHPNRVRRVYYGIDRTRFLARPDPAAAKRALGLDTSRPIVLFVGALGDRRKGFDTLFAAWSDLCRNPEWDPKLLVVGSGAELRNWQTLVTQHRELDGRVVFMGHRTDVPALIAAADVMVHPARYEAYGLAVHEALCCGVPAIVSASAGIAELIPDDLRGLLLEDTESASELATLLRTWRGWKDEYRERALAFGATLGSRTWDDMARDVVALAQS
jgi:glycosyltransferase involved in cell wall biosynthesis